MNNQSKKFWIDKSKLIEWQNKPKKIYKIKKNFHTDWYPDGKLNVYDNCVSRHIKNGISKKISLITVNTDKKYHKYTYQELDNLVNNFCFEIKKIFKNKNLFSKKIMIHSSASIYSAVSMLSCARLGINFSVIFENLQLDAINNRIKIFKPDLFISRWKSMEFYKKFPKSKLLKSKFIFFNNLNIFKKNKKKIQSSYFNSSKSLFTLFTSGSTGMPKGIVHSTGGYLVYSKLTCKNQFGMNSNSVVLTASDAAWINGHTYALFGPLSFGATTILLESPMILLDTLLLKKILKLNVTVLYLPVTLIRLMKALFKDIKFKYKNLKTLGSMGEPLAPSVGKWFAETFNLKEKSIVNTYFQTETGGIISSPKYTDDSKRVPHGSVGKPVDKKIEILKLFNDTKKEIIVKTNWPGCMKDVINGKKEWNKYWNNKGYFRMFDLGTIKNQNIYVHGRVDDVINIRGHRIGSEEIESTVLKIKDVHECCAVLINDVLGGAAVQLFITSKKQNLDKIIEDKINLNFGSFALPKKIYYLTELPKTRSGKILRRLLREMINSSNFEYSGDTSTMLNPKIIDEIKSKLRK